jgi:long-chain fatty acid transport protein
LPSLSVGGGVMINYAKIEMSQGLKSSQTPFTNFFNFNGDGWSLGGNVGALWQPCEKISIGATFRSSAMVTLNGQTHYEQQYIIPNSHSPANMSMNFPWTAVAGISYRPTPKWNLEFDANYTDWSSFGMENLQQQNPPQPLKSDIPVRLDWQGSWMYEFGVTRYFNNGWHISGGYVFNENSVPDKFYTPLAADMDRDFFSVGAGYNGKMFDFDIAYQFGYGPTHTVTGSQPSSTPISIANPVGADGKYGFTSSALILSVGMHF